MHGKSPAISAAFPAVMLYWDSIYLGPNTETPSIMNVSEQTAPQTNMKGIFLIRFQMARGKSFTLLRKPERGVKLAPL